MRGHLQIVGLLLFVFGRGAPEKVASQARAAQFEYYSSAGERLAGLFNRETSGPEARELFLANRPAWEGLHNPRSCSQSTVLKRAGDFITSTFDQPVHAVSCIYREQSSWCPDGNCHASQCYQDGSKIMAGSNPYECGDGSWCYHCDLEECN